jgi:hypothetical protein
MMPGSALGNGDRVLWGRELSQLEYLTRSAEGPSDGSFTLLGLTAVLGLMASSTDAATPGDYRQLAREMLQELIEIKSSDSGVGSTPAAEAIARRMRAAGFPEADIQVIGPAERKKNVVVRLHGRGKAQPTLIIGHLDVVEAEKGDWSADPATSKAAPFACSKRAGVPTLSCGSSHVAVPTPG